MPRIKLLDLAWAIALFVSLAWNPASADTRMTITGTPPATATVGSLYAFTPTVSNGNKSTLQFSYLNLPSWSGHYRGSGAIIGTPTTAGTYSNIVIQAWDGTQFAQTTPFTIKVAASTTTTPPPTTPPPPPPTTPPPTTTPPTSSTPATSGTWVNVTPSNAKPAAVMSCGNYGVETVQVDPNKPSNLYAFFHCQGVWKSTDYGATWSGPINTGSNGARISDCAGGITIPPSSTASVATIYISCIRGSGLGFWKSLDGGVNWTNYQVPPGSSGYQDFYPPVIDPYDENHLVMPGHEQNFLRESKDGGKTWSNVPMASGMMQTGGTGEIFFINTGNAATTRTTWLWLAQESGGKYGTWRTTNSGTSWVKVDNNEHPHGSSQIYQPDTKGTVYMAGSYSALGNGVLRSTDYGQTWNHVGSSSSGETAVAGTPNSLYAMYGWPIGIGGTVNPALEIAPQPGTGIWSGTATPAGMTQGVSQIRVVNDGTHSILVAAMHNAGLWRYVETATSSSGSGSGSGTGTGGGTSPSSSTVALSAATYTVAQNAGSLTISVTRTGTNTGAASIRFATADGTAAAGKDYTATSGTVSWAAGDTTSKSFPITISNTTPFTGTKTLTVTLSGATGTSVGAAAATITINGSGASSGSGSGSGSGGTSGPGINFTPAPTLSGITMVQNRDSVIIKVPAVANARDFRVLVQPTAVSANSNGTEMVKGGTVFCAGLRQHQARTRFVADPVSLYPYYFYINAATDSPTNENPPNFFSAPPTAWKWYDLDTPPNLAIEVTGVTSNQTVTVEAIDRLCPFPGAIGRTHVDIATSHGVDVNHPENPWIDAMGIASFPIVTKAEVIAKYGTLIINGQGWAGGANVQATPPSNPPFAQPAPVNPPVVLARGTINIAPLASPPAPPSAFFDDFSNSNDTFQTLPIPNWTYGRFLAGQLVLQNSKWTVYGNGFTCCNPTSGLDGHGYADAYIDGGAMHMNLGDWSQDVLSEVSMFPRKAAHLNSTNYLHITYEVNSFATARRYWVVSLCGSATAGQTLDGTGALKEQIVHSTFFYDNTGLSPSTAGWNCLQVFNREGNSYALSNWESMHNLKGGRPPVPPNKGLFDLNDYIYNAIPSISDPTRIAAYTVHPESDVVVLVNKPIPKANLPEVWGANQQVVKSSVTSPVNVSPMQLDNPAGEVAWFYKVDTNGNPVAPILDDQQLVAPRTKYDLYVRNNRLIMYVNGKAALCNDFTTPTTTLKIADAAVGFHQVLYHSSGEFVERFEGPDRGAAYHYRYNSPFMDQRNWDNVGFEENVAAPSDFNAATCFQHTSMGAENNEP